MAIKVAWWLKSAAKKSEIKKQIARLRCTRPKKAKACRISVPLCRGWLEPHAGTDPAALHRDRGSRPAVQQAGRQQCEPGPRHVPEAQAGLQHAAAGPVPARRGCARGAPAPGYHLLPRRVQDDPGTSTRNGNLNTREARMRKAAPRWHPSARCGIT